MTTKRIRSRILEYFSPQLLKDLYRVCKSSIISDNNLKVETMLNILNEYKIDYVELGPGTNRLAILIDNYVFKLALDKWGLQDNINEFTVSQELQPHVVKTYETNDLISVCEYVTVISRDEFMDNKETIRNILGILAEGYLLGDVGTVAKNFCNWGYRDNGDLVILDFAYIYRIQGEEMLCSSDQTMLEYDENFYNLKCPTCGRKHSFMDVRRKIPMEYEVNENMIARQLSYKLTKEVETVTDRYTEEEELPAESSDSLYKENIETPIEEGFTMKHDKFIPKDEEYEDSYLETMKSLRINRTNDNQVLSVDIANDDHIKTQTIDIEKRTSDSVTHIRVFKQEIDPGDDNDTTEDFLREAISEIHNAENEVQSQILLGEIVEVDTEDVYKHMETEEEPAEYVTMEQAPRYSTAPYLEDQQRAYSADEEEEEYLKGLDFVKSHHVEIDEDEDDTFEPNSSIHIHAKDADIEIHPDGSVELHADEIEVEGVELSGDTDGDYKEEEAFNKDFVDGSNSDDEEFEEKEEDMDENPEFYDNDPENEEVVKVENVEIVTHQDTTEAVVIDHTVRLSDTLAIKSVVTVESTSTDEESLRAELAKDLLNDDDAGDEMAATFDEEKVDGVAAQYMHLQYEAEEEDNGRRNRNKKDWK